MMIRILSSLFIVLFVVLQASLVAAESSAAQELASSQHDLSFAHVKAVLPGHKRLLEKRHKKKKKSSKKKSSKKKSSKKSSKSSGSGQKYTGTATWFKPVSEGGAEGACGGFKANNNSPIVALNRPQYGDLDSKSKWCGKKIQIKGPAGTATAKITDACPGCKKGDLDLTPAIFKKVVGDMNKGVGKITWSVI